MVMTFFLHLLSHYNSITESRARFLLALIEDLTVDFPFQFILSFIDVYRDTVTCDKLIFPFAITRIICHSSVSYLESPHFSIMGAISMMFVRRSEAQLRLKWPRTKTTTPSTHSTPSTSALSSADGVTLEAIMAQLKRMDARFETLSDELCQVNTRVGRIAQRQDVMGGFITSPSPSPQASEDEGDDGDDDADEDEDEDASSSNDKELTASQ